MNILFAKAVVIMLVATPLYSIPTLTDLVYKYPKAMLAEIAAWALCVKKSPESHDQKKHKDEHDDLQNLKDFVQAEAKKFSMTHPLEVVLGEEGWQAYCEEYKIMAPLDAQDVFNRGPIDPRYYDYKGSLFHEFGHLLLCQRKKKERSGVDEEYFADSCVPDDEPVLKELRDEFFEEHKAGGGAACNGLFTEGKAFERRCKRLYKKQYPNDDHPCPYMRAKYFHRRLLQLQRKNQ